MRAPGVAGVSYGGRGQNLFPTGTERAIGNQLPPITGANGPLAPPAPGYWHVGGQVGGTGDGAYGADPRVGKIQPFPRLARVLGLIKETGEQWGSEGYNDKLTVKDRHAYWDRGYQRTGTTFIPEGAQPNTYNNPLEQPPRPDLRLVNRTVSYQLGTDKTRNQDDLTRPYTWLGEQGAPWTPVSGGVPGLYQPYGTRGGVPYPIVSPVAQGAPGDGTHLVSGGPPHGLHSQTPWKGGEQIIRRFASIPQTRPVRFDRPSNSPQAGQSYSQTVQQQGASPVRPSGPPPGRAQGPMRFTGRGWSGRGAKGQFS